MWLLECLEASAAKATLWTAGYSLLSFLYFLLFAFAMVPVVRFRRSFSVLSSLQRWTRISALFSLIFKAVCDFISVFVGRYASGAAPIAIAFGLTLLEFPPYVIGTCYCLSFLCFLSVCFQDAPNLFVRVLRLSKIAFLCYNVCFYILFLFSFITETAEWFHNNETRTCIVAGISVVRDFALCLIFVVFVLVIRHDIGEDNFANLAGIQQKLVFGALILSIALLVRGSFTLVEGIALRHGNDECQTGFFAWFLFNEMAVEGIPLALLVRVTNVDLEQAERTRNMHLSLLSHADAHF
jgi:hypothetical protein